MIFGRQILVLVSVLLAWETMTDVGTAWAQGKSPDAGIAIVDVSTVLEKSLPAKNLRQLIEKTRADYRREVDAKRNEIEKLGEGIEQARSGLSEDEFQKRMRNLRQKIANNESDMRERQSKLEGAFAAAPQKIGATIEQIVDEIRKERKYQLVLPRSIVVGASDAPDITQEVLDRLNKRMPTVDIDIPK
jgi:Skp family chaperone for outer membrane proteins